MCIRKPHLCSNSIYCFQIRAFESIHMFSEITLITRADFDAKKNMVNTGTKTITVQRPKNTSRLLPLSAWNRISVTVSRSRSTSAGHVTLLTQLPSRVMDKHVAETPLRRQVRQHDGVRPARARRIIKKSIYRQRRALSRVPGRAGHHGGGGGGGGMRKKRRRLQRQRWRQSTKWRRLKLAYGRRRRAGDILSSTRTDNGRLAMAQRAVVRLLSLLSRLKP